MRDAEAVEHALRALVLPPVEAFEDGSAACPWPGSSWYTTKRVPVELAAQGQGAAEGARLFELIGSQQRHAALLPQVAADLPVPHGHRPELES
jgi:hypothetical protein